MKAILAGAALGATVALFQDAEAPRRIVSSLRVKALTLLANGNPVALNLEVHDGTIRLRSHAVAINCAFTRTAEETVTLAAGQYVTRPGELRKWPPSIEGANSVDDWRFESDGDDFTMPMKRSTASRKSFITIPAGAQRITEPLRPSEGQRFEGQTSL